ncbi:hypothetical protein ACVIW2_005486 [Bradyrhizobium huanghuaihaiense]|uniref:Uncharacterized protein n=1 Tax=Bradyrhizobium huanghuaihaiense TaxID=990078 RepID=A0A562S499_9BRAD|nr:hypothetical protein IQ16_00370 [Bradyrhizobium huanghuaihaiense]
MIRTMGAPGGPGASSVPASGPWGPGIAIVCVLLAVADDCMAVMIAEIASPHTTRFPVRSATAFCTKYIATSVTIVVMTTT